MAIKVSAKLQMIIFGQYHILVPYDPEYTYPGKHPQYHGAPPVAMTKLTEKKEYRLVGANELGFNFIFVKKRFADDILPKVNVESALKHPSVNEGYKKFEEVKHMKFIEG